MSGLLCRIVLVVINLIFGLISLITLAAGAIFAWRGPVIQSVMSSLLESVLGQLGDQADTVKAEAIDTVLQITRPTGLALFFFGLTGLIFSLIGFVGAISNSKLALIIYAALTAALLIAHIIATIVYFPNKSRITESLRSVLQGLVDKYESVNSRDFSSLSLAALMIQEHDPGKLIV